MAEQLGDLTRTHTCGALRPDDVGADVVLLGWVHRVRDLGGLLFIDVRDRAGVTQVVFDKDDEALMAQGQAPALRVRRRRRGPRAAPLGRDGQPEARRPARSRSSSARLTLLNEAKTPPFPIADDTPVSEDVRLKYRYLDLRRPRLQSNIVLRHRVTIGDPAATSTSNGFLEIETPILDEVHARRRARLPGAEPRASGRVLRAAAVAAALQADPDDRGHGPLRADLQVLPRRGPARRSPARVHAGRRRDVVRAAGDDLRRHRAADARHLRA